MIQILTTVMPVIVMLLIGWLCRIKKWIPREGVDNIKFLVTRLLLPIAIFNALSTADYSVNTLIQVGIIFVMLVVSMLAGYAMKPLNRGAYQKYTPFMVSVYEGGMIAYPLFMNLCGNENLSKIAIIDIAGLLFGFSVYMNLLEQVQDGRKSTVKDVCHSAVKNPAFIAAVLGVVFGLTHVIGLLQASPAGVVYSAVIDLATSPLTPMILIVVGYDVAPDRSILKEALRTIVLRAALQFALAAAVLFAMNRILGSDTIRDIAVICYMSAPATFSMQSFLKDEDSSRYASTTNSLYCVVSIAVYVVLASVRSL